MPDCGIRPRRLANTLIRSSGSNCRVPQQHLGHSSINSRLFGILVRKRRVNTAFEVCPGLYRAIAGPKAHRKTYRQFPPGFFDPIVIDECHRGSAADDSVWREIPEYVSPATRIGLTATPMETRYVFNIGCFGERCYDLSTATSPESGR